MYTKSFLAALAVPALVSGAALPQNDPDNWDENSSDIVGGVAASAGDFPFIVSIQRSNGAHFCGGTLINGNTVVTAAHCSVGQTASAVRIRAGTLNNNSGGVVANVASIKIHPQYNDATFDNDIAIWKLSSSVSGSGISYAALAPSGSDPNSGVILTVGGWGRTTEGGSAPSALRKVDVPVIARNNCADLYVDENITGNMVCAGYSQGGKDACQGDSGGPIIDSSKTLIGVVSWGYGCARAGLPGVYASVGALNAWIKNNS